MTTRRGIVVLGSTGSIGTQTLDVVRALPDRFRVVGLAAGNNVGLLREQVAELGVEHVACATAVDLPGVRQMPMEELVGLPGVDLVVVATSSTTALHATLTALRLGRNVATANKEVLVAAGEIVVETARRAGARLLPIDGEHSAVWQCLRGEEGNEVTRIVLTASGGAFRDLPLDELDGVTPEQALRHPVWRMGTKITVDAATLANKAFEVIEAHWLFELPYDRIDVAVHRESIVHALVQFADGSSKAQLGLPDMRVPIQYALTYPERVAGPVGHLDVTALGRLTFGPIDHERYPAFGKIVEAGRAGGTYPAVVSAANDEAVDAFLAGRVGFRRIAEALGDALDAHRPVSHPDLDAVIDAEEWARRHVRARLGGKVQSAVAGT